MVSEDREEMLVHCVELDFLTLASGVSRLQTQCPCQSGGWTPGRENVKWGVWCEVIIIIFFLSICLWLHFLYLCPCLQWRRGRRKRPRYIMIVRAYSNIISERNTETEFPMGELPAPLNQHTHTQIFLQL